MTWLEAFEMARIEQGVPPRPLFVRALGAEAAAGYAHNRLTLDMFVQFMRDSKPLRGKREQVSSETISSYASAVHLFVSREARYDICPEESDLNSSLAFKTWRKEDPLKGERELGRGVRIVDFDAAARAGFDRFSRQGVVDWAVGLVSHNCFLRGGEPGEQDDPMPEAAKRVIRWSWIKWMPPSESSGWKPWLLIWIVPIKDTSGKHCGYPTPVGPRRGGAFGADHLCVYDAVAAAWWSRRAPGTPFPVDTNGEPVEKWWLLEPAQRQTTGCAEEDPFFTVGGRVWRTSDTRRLGQRIMAYDSSIPASEIHARCFRVGGATDLRARRGQGSEAAIQQRGRWKTDIGQIYARHIVAEQLRLSMDVSLAGGTDLERLCEGMWAQPARTR